MAEIKVNTAKKIQGVIEMPGDKSISQRAIMIGSIAEGITKAGNFLMGDDCLLTINAFREMGVDIKEIPNPKFQIPNVMIEGKGLRGLKKPGKELYLGNSGTTMRIILGILAGQDFECSVTGDESLSKRPMKRVAEPLEMMGAKINPKSKIQNPKSQDIYPPLTIKGRYPLKSIKYKLPIASAQVKSAILLAGLYGDGQTEIEEPLKSRDHTERMLKEFGADIKTEGLKMSIRNSKLKSKSDIFIPGDISSAAFFIVAALILKSSEITIKNLGVNPTRTGIIDVLKKMGAKIEIANLREDGFEPMADITVKAGGLDGIDIGPEIIPRVIDELPAIMVAAVFSKGLTTIKGAGELRVKETDRILSMVTNLKNMGADIQAKDDNIMIKGTGSLKGCRVDSFGDHRTAMSMVVAGLKAEGETVVLNTGCIDKSFPRFWNLITKVQMN